MLIRFAISSIASLMTCAVLIAADDSSKSETKKTESAADQSPLAEEVAELNKDYTSEYGKYTQALKRYSDYQAEVKKKVQELIKNNAEDPAVVDAAKLLVEKLRTPATDELLELLQTNQLKNPKLGEFCLKLTRPTPSLKNQENFLQKVAAEHADEKARGMATYALGEFYNFQAMTVRDKNAVAEQDRYLAEAEKYLTKAKSDFPAIASERIGPRATLGERTDKLLSRVRNIPNVRVGKTAPEIAATDIDGQPLKLSDSRGKVTVLIFWGSWCGPCMSLVPHEKELYERMKGKPFEMLSVNCGDARDKAQDTRKTKEMPWRCWWDEGTNDGPIQALYAVPHYPNIFVLDGKGTIRYVDVRQKELDEAVDKLLAEMEAGKTAQR
jgi:thiol-disulfide isomerase/thioredoxin